MNDENKKILSKNIKQLMDKNNISRYQMSNDLGVSYNTLTKWIIGLTYPRMDKIDKIANYFNVPKSVIVEKQKSNSMADTIYNTVSSFSEEEQTKVIRLINSIVVSDMSKSDKKQLTNEYQIFNLFDKLSLKQQDMVIGFAMAQLQK